MAEGTQEEQLVMRLPQKRQPVGRLPQEEQLVINISTAADSANLLSATSSIGLL